MALNNLALELKDAYEKHKKTSLTFFTSYLIDISKQFDQEFHESLMTFIKLLFKKISTADVKFIYSMKTAPLFTSFMSAVLCDKYTVTSKLEEEVIFSLISLAEFGEDPKYKFDSESIFQKADIYIEKNGKFTKEVETTIQKIVEKNI